MKNMYILTTKLFFLSLTAVLLIVVDVTQSQLRSTVVKTMCPRVLESYIYFEFSATEKYLKIAKCIQLFVRGASASLTHSASVRCIHTCVYIYPPYLIQSMCEFLWV